MLWTALLGVVLVLCCLVPESPAHGQASEAEPKAPDAPASGPKSVGDSTPGSIDDSERASGAESRAGSDSIVTVDEATQPTETLTLSIENAIRVALSRNFSIRLSELTQQISERDLTVERAVFDPFLTLSGTYNNNRRPTASFLDIGGGALIPEVQVNPFRSTNYSAAITGRTALGTTYNLELSESGFDRPLASSLFGLNPQESASARATFTQPVLRGAWYPYNSAQLRIATNNVRLAREDLELAINDLVYQVESAYWNLVFATENFEAKVNALEVAREDLSKAIKEEKAGTKARIFVTTVKGQLRLREIDHNDARLLLESARDSLLQLLNHGGDSLKARWQDGRDIGPYDGVRIVPTSKPEPEVFAPERDVSLAMAFRKRPDYRRFDIQLDNQRIQVDMAENGLLPRLDLTATWEQFGLDDSMDGAFSSLGTGQFYGWSAGVQLEIPLSNRGRKATYRKAQDELRRLTWQRVELENQMVIEIDQSIRLLASTWRKIQFLEDVVEFKSEEFEAEKKKLEAGTSIPFAVHTIENDLIAQQASVLQARADYLTARAEYYKLTGVLLERYGVVIED